MARVLVSPPSPPPLSFLKISPPFFTPSPKTHLFFPSRNRFLQPLYSAKLPSLLPSIPATQEPRQTFQSFNFLKPYLFSQAKPILAGWLCALVSVFSLSKLVPKAGKLLAAITNVDALRLRSEALFFGVLVLARLVASYWQQVFLWDAALNTVYRIRCYVFERVLERDLEFFECGGNAVSAGDIAYRITAEAADVGNAVYVVLNTIVPSTLQLSAMAVQMLIVSPTLSLISAVVIPCLALVIVHLGEKLRRISKEAHMSIAGLSAYLNEVLPAILFVKANNSELCESARFQRLAHTNLSKQLNKKKMKAFIPQIIQSIYFGALFVFCAGSLVVSSGALDACSMVSFVTSLFFLVEPIQGVGKAYNDWKQGEPAIERLFDLTRFNSKVIKRPDAIDLDNVTGEVEFCDISFRYGDDTPFLLNGLNLHIKAGETVALVGPSGGGKTTLIKLLLRLYDPLSGCIRIDNRNIQDIQLDSLRRHVSLVSQDITLFSGTVAENIGYRDLMSKIDMERVKYAAQTANADEFIRKLPEGYKTDIGPRGSILSGGQKQRVALARALYQNSSILILDEATSALDRRSELLVRQAVERMMENHTVLVIAHRLETVLMAKRVFLLHNGKLEELTRSVLLDSHPVRISVTSTACGAPNIGQRKKPLPTRQ